MGWLGENRNGRTEPGTAICDKSKTAENRALEAIIYKEDRIDTALASVWQAYLQVPHANPSNSFKFWTEASLFTRTLRKTAVNIYSHSEKKT